ncbi:hypothetical protein FM110_07595 [Brachybacterium nesterenkovii]|uniref:Uncharacterized protein n=1 Tax=Brachybacterium nesterenkovii TaxID=47847 RepID=A0A1X6X0Z7_9MICO|nr:hypothetical protein FM110_07595 [Brachybacterium nesterenkovii]
MRIAAAARSCVAERARSKSDVLRRRRRGAVDERLSTGASGAVGGACGAWTGADTEDCGAGVSGAGDSGAGASADTSAAAFTGVPAADASVAGATDASVGAVPSVVPGGAATGAAVGVEGATAGTCSLSTGCSPVGA